MSKYFFFIEGRKIPIKTAIILSLFACLFIPGVCLAEINVDGKLDESEWTNAQRFHDFVVVDPMTFNSPRLQTQALLTALPEGLAVAFICDQPQGETRTRTITQRDAQRFDSDIVSLMVDFDGTGEVAYEFTVSIAGSYRDGTITNENSSSRDWDGLWQRAVNEEQDSWTVEILLPWSITTMRKGDGDTRQLGVCFQRDVYSSGETFSFPATSSSLSRFVSDFARIEVTSYSTHEFNVWPYVTVLSDIVNNSITGKAGLDLFWKPDDRLQVAATFNPDFGQVESDNLVINFSATETSFNEKRPFFTENQGIFSSIFPKGDRVFYTRRIGGPRDDNGGATDIDGALKVIGSAGPLNYGLFTAHEADDAGRRYYAGRLIFPAENWLLGALSTYTERPFLDRTALVNSLDYDVRIGDVWRFIGQFVISEIDTAKDNKEGFGSFNIIEYTPDDQWNYEFSLLQYSDTVDLNDMGYIQRNNLKEWYFSVQFRQTDFPENSSTASVSWQATTITRWNTYGDQLTNTIRLSREQRMRSGAAMSLNMYLYTEGYDDLISRGNGLVRLNKRWNGSFSYSTPRRGAWRKSIGLDLFQEGYDDWAADLEGNVTWYPHEKLNLEFGLTPRWSRDWLIWLRGNQFASYSRQQVTGEISANWFPAEGHELRLRTQWYVINADAEQGYRIGPGGRLIRSNDMINDFAMLNFGLQLRYRYEIAPLSDFYIVYSRGGLDRIDNSSHSTLDLLGKSTSIRKSDQILVKVRYRF